MSLASLLGVTHMQFKGGKVKAQMRMSVFTEVYAIYEQDTKETFNYEHGWGILKDQPRWKEPLNESSSKRSKISSLREGGVLIIFQPWDANKLWTWLNTGGGNKPDSLSWAHDLAWLRPDLA